MSAHDQHDVAIPSRMAELEDRVQWLETTLDRVLGQRSARPTPDAYGHSIKAAQDPQGVITDEFDPWMLRTQPLPAISVPLSLTGQNSVFEIDPGLFKTRKMPQADASTVIDIDPELFKTRKMPSAQDPATSPEPAHHMPQVNMAGGLDRTQPSALEQHYPSILQKITALWCSGEARNYLKKLVDDDRGARHGFDPAAMMELRMLTSILAQHEREARWGTMPVAA